MIVPTITVLKQHIATVVGTDFARYEPYLKTAEKFMIREITGRDLYDLADGYPDLLNLMQAVVAHKGYLEAIPFLDLIETESGFAVTSNQNLTPASTKRVQDLIAATEKRLTECVEDLLEYLETASEDLQDAWKGSKTFTLVNDNYIESIRQFREYGPFEGSRLAWIVFRPKLAAARKLKIEPVISRELSEEIIEQLRDGDLNESNTLIIHDLRFALAAFATGDMPTGDSFIARVRAFLMAHPDDFTAFRDSEIYQAYLALVERDTTDDPIAIFGV